MLERIPHATISIISYPLAPNSPAPAAFPQLLDVYNQLLVEAQRAGEIVTIMGDSAGGNLALCVPLEALRINSDGPKPHSIMAICPSVDMCRDDPHLKEIEKHDPILQIKFIQFTAKGWRGEWEETDPRVSPIRSEHLDLFRKAGVKIDGATAGYDLLGLDGRNFREKIAEVGIQGEWLDHDRQMHCWPLVKVYKIFPESNQAFDWITDVLKRRSQEEVLVVDTSSSDEKTDLNV
jgi:acetyl esterase/lipase